MPEGQTEVEIYSTWNRATWADGAVEKHDLQLELEHGITDRWDVSLYHVFARPGRRRPPCLMLSEMKLRSRYRFAERGELPVDVLAYGELIRDVRRQRLRRPRSRRCWPATSAWSRSPPT
jgi:hypothetical protein